MDPIKRGPGRPRTEQRAAVRAPLKIRTPENRFDVDDDLRPEGMTYEWKRFSVYGQEDRSSQVNYAYNGWKAVPAGRHPELTGAQPNDERAIIIDGLMLMERETELTERIRELDNKAAKDQVDTQLERLQIKAREDGYDSAKVQRRVMTVHDDD